MSLDEPDDVIEFLFMLYRKISMMDLIHGHSFTDLDEFIGGNMIFDDSFHLIIHGSRKGIGLFDVFQLCPDSFDITDKSHIKHPIHFIQNEIFCDADIDHLLIHKIHQSAWCCDNDCRIFFENIFLDVRTSSSIETGEFYPVEFRQTSYFFTYLNDKLSCRRKDQCL
jgi:hypothetical protein